MIKTYLELSVTDGDSAVLWNPDRVIAMQSIEQLYEPFSLNIHYRPEIESLGFFPNSQSVIKSIGVAPGMHVEVKLKSFEIEDKKTGKSLDFISYASVKGEEPLRERIFCGIVESLDVLFQGDSFEQDNFHAEFKICSVLKQLKEQKTHICYRDHMVSDIIKSSFNISNIEKFVECSSLMELELGDGNAKITEKKAELQEEIVKVEEDLKKEKDSKAKVDKDLAAAEKNLNEDEQKEVSKQYIANQKNKELTNAKKQLKENVKKINELLLEFKSKPDDFLNTIFAINRLMKLSEQISDNVELSDKNQLKALREEQEKLHAKIAGINTKVLRLNAELSEKDSEKIKSEIHSLSSEGKDLIVILESKIISKKEEQTKGDDKDDRAKHSKLLAKKTESDRKIYQLKQKAASIRSDLSGRVPKSMPIFRYTEFIIPGVSLWDVNNLICSETKTVFISDWEKSKKHGNKKEEINLLQGAFLYYPYYGAVLNVGHLGDDDDTFQIVSQSEQRGSFLSSFYEDELQRAPIDLTLKNENDQMTPFHISRNKEAVIESSYGHHDLLAVPPIRSQLDIVVGLSRRCNLFPGVKVALVNPSAQDDQSNMYVVTKVKHVYHNNNDQKNYYHAIITVESLNYRQNSEKQQPDQLLPIHFNNFEIFNKSIEMAVLNPSKQIDSYGGIIEQDSAKNNRILLTFPHIYYTTSKNEDILPDVVTNYAIWVKQIQAMAAANLGLKTVPSSGARAIVSFKDAKPYLPIVLGYNFTPSSVSETTDKSKEVDDSIFSVYLGQSYISMGVAKDE